MKRQLAVIVAACSQALWPALAQQTSGPSFDCAKARSVPEKLICADADLARLDRDLSALYSAARAAATDQDEFRKQAVAELRAREQTCVDRACLVQWYEKRKVQLSQFLRPAAATTAPPPTPTPAPQPALAPARATSSIVGAWTCPGSRGEGGPRAYFFGDNGAFALHGRDGRMLIEIVGPYSVTSNSLRMVEGVSRITEGSSLLVDWSLVAPGESYQRSNYRDRSLTIVSLDDQKLRLKSEWVTYRPGGPADRGNPFVLDCQRDTSPGARATWQAAPMLMVRRVQMP